MAWLRKSVILTFCNPFFVVDIPLTKGDESHLRVVEKPRVNAIAYHTFEMSFFYDDTSCFFCFFN